MPGKSLTAAVVTATALGSGGALAQTVMPGAIRAASDITLGSGFDHIGAQVQSVDINGRAAYFIDDGASDGRPVVIISGQGTSLAAFQLTEFNRSTRLAPGLRMISVERNGFGGSPLDPGRGYADYAAEVLAVLDHLNVDKFPIVAMSGGGAYAAPLAVAMPQRVLSLHATAAVASALPTLITVPVSAMEQWQAALGNVVRAKVYDGQGHTVQYRHWDQILTDIAGLGDYTVVCQDGETRLIANGEVTDDTFLGNWAWQ